MEEWGKEKILGSGNGASKKERDTGTKEEENPRGWAVPSSVQPKLNV